MGFAVVMTTVAMVVVMLMLAFAVVMLVLMSTVAVVVVTCHRFLCRECFVLTCVLIY